MAGKQQQQFRLLRSVAMPEGVVAQLQARLTQTFPDEPRRSVRATKGQHTKNPDLLDQTPEPKKKTSKKSKKLRRKQRSLKLRSFVVFVERRRLEMTKERPGLHATIARAGNTTSALVYLYLRRMFQPITFASNVIQSSTKNYLMPSNVAKRYGRSGEKDSSKKKPRKNKGARRRKGKRRARELAIRRWRSTMVQMERQSLLLLLHSRTGRRTRQLQEPEVQRERISTGPKRYVFFRTIRIDSTNSPKEPQSKVRKVSAAPRQETPTNGLPVKIIDLETARQGGAKLIQKGLLHAIPIALNNAIYVLAKGDTVDTKAERLAIEVEDAVHKTHADKAAYNKQARALFNNLKQNQELCNGLLTRSLSPAALAVMTTDDMASKELKKETAEMKARADKQSIMVTDDGPRIRRTHKGEEMIESDNFAVSNDSTMSTARRRSMLDPNADMATRSRENSPGDEVELPASIGEFRSQDDIRGHTIPKQPLNIETKVPVPTRKASTQPDFDINRVFSSVQSPVTAQHVRRPSMNNAPPAGGPGVDPEIDKMLQDDDGNESPPYSPAEYSSDPDIVWRGNVAMDAIAKFPAVAKHIAGADISRSIPWTSILQKDLKVAGRIDQEKANEYLCSLRYSPPTDVVVVNLTPTGEAASQGFIELYEYFQSKSRYGVLTNKGVGNIRDTYLVPVPPSPGNLPDFIINLEGHKVPEDRPSPMVLVALVIRSEWQPESHRGTDNHSPSVPSHPQRQMSISGAGPQMSPIQAQGAFASPPQAPPQMTPQQIEEKRARDQREGELNGIRILGPHKDAPTVAFLMPHAYQMRPIEWQIVRSILEEDERARVDLQHLSQMIEIRNAQT